MKHNIWHKSCWQLQVKGAFFISFVTGKLGNEHSPAQKVHHTFFLRTLDIGITITRFPAMCGHLGVDSWVKSGPTVSQMEDNDTM